MKLFKIWPPKASLRTVILLVFACVIPIIAAHAMSYLPEEKTDIPTPAEAEDTHSFTYIEPEDNTQALQVLEKEQSAPLQDYPDVIAEIPPETELENEASSDEREILTEAPSQPVNGLIIGNIHVPAIELSDMLAVGTSLDGAQKALETSSVIMCYEYMGLPEKALISVVGGHNYMEFNKLKNAKVGDDVILNLDWGVYEYMIYDIKIQTALSSAPKDCLVLYTCYPFDQRFHTTESAYFLCKPKATDMVPWIYTARS